MTMALDVVAFLERAMDDARTTNFAGLYYLVTGSVIAGAPRNEGDITSFEARHPIGSRARLALALLLYTGQRRSDVVRMGRQHVRDGAIDVRQQKTGTELSIPMHPELQAVIEASEVEHLTFLITKNGKPFSPAGFTN